MPSSTMLSICTVVILSPTVVTLALSVAMLGDGLAAALRARDGFPLPPNTNTNISAHTYTYTYTDLKCTGLPLHPWCGRCVGRPEARA